ncbi:MAG: hypothetical protein HC771_06685 [Synechococcales cyanobacterium CRU_2_2]|nr:hypothetical protein [Synechococcales cyanobacterium CRU_2_2]
MHVKTGGGGVKCQLDGESTRVAGIEVALLERLLLERLAIAGIARVMQRSESCIQTYVNAKVKTIPKKVEVTKR